MIWINQLRWTRRHPASLNQIVRQLIRVDRAGVL